jgi:autotransporter-associated beta strand protein
LAVGHAQATPAKRTVGAFDLTFYNKRDSDGTSRGSQNWTTDQMNDVAASIAVWTGRLTNTPGRQVQVHLFWNSFTGGTLGDYSGPSNGDGTTSWTYVEHAWRDGVNYTGPWTGFDSRIRFDTDAAGYGWNFGSGLPASDKIDFRTVVTHEVGHAVGFKPSYYNNLWGLCRGTSSDPFASAGYLGLSEWDKDLLDGSGNRPANAATGTPGDFNQEANPVWFTGSNAVAYYGGNVPVYAPSPYEGGSSLSHLDESRIPGALMSPYVTLGEAIRQPLRLEWEIMEDLGWSVLTTKTWTKGGGTLSWANAANWSPDGTPDATWDVLLDGSGLADGDVLDIGGNQSVNLLSIDSGAGFTIGGASGTLTIAKGNLVRSAASSGVQTIARPVALGTSAIWDIAGSGRLAVSGPISGSGFGLEKRGQGTLLLSGANTYSGATVVKAGTLLVGADAPSGSPGALGSATSNVLLGDTSGAADASLLIVGPYTVGRGVTVQAGSAGNVTLGGTNTSGTATFAGSVGLARSAALTAAAGGTVAFTGTVSGAGGVAKTGGGTLVLTTANSYNGGTTVSEGTLLVNNTAGSGTGSGAVTVGAATLGGTGIISGPVLLAGDSTLIGGTLISTGTLTINNTLTISGDANQLPSGTILTSGNVTINPGAVFILNGTLGGGTGTLIVRGTLMGKGTIGKSVSIEAGGTFSPGAPSAILTLDQVIVAETPQAFSFEIGAPGPDYTSPSSSVNDVLRLTSETLPFANATGDAPASLTADTVIDVYFIFNDPPRGEYKSEFFAGSDFTEAVHDATVRYWRLDPRGGHLHNSNFFSPLDGSLVDWSVVPETAAFGGIEASGYITQFTVVPEPCTLALVALGGLAILRARRR